MTPLIEAQNENKRYKEKPPLDLLGAEIKERPRIS
jgi:hypothetical protein